MSGPRPASREAIFDELRKVFVAEFGFAESQLGPETRLVDDLDLDSIDFVDMAVALESRLGERLEEKDVVSVRTLGDVVTLIERRLRPPAP